MTNKVIRRSYRNVSQFRPNGTFRPFSLRLLLDGPSNSVRITHKSSPADIEPVSRRESLRIAGFPFGFVNLTDAARFALRARRILNARNSLSVRTVESENVDVVAYSSNGLRGFFFVRKRSFVFVFTPRHFPVPNRVLLTLYTSRSTVSSPSLPPPKVGSNFSPERGEERQHSKYCERLRDYKREFRLVCRIRRLYNAVFEIITRLCGKTRSGVFRSN